MSDRSVLISSHKSFAVPSLPWPAEEVSDTWHPARASPPHSQRLADICSTKISSLVQCQPSTASWSNPAPCCEPMKTFQHQLPSKCLPQKITARVGLCVNTKSAGIIHVHHTGSLLPKGGRQREAQIQSCLASCSNSHLCRQQAASSSKPQCQTNKVAWKWQGLVFTTLFPNAII